MALNKEDTRVVQQARPTASMSLEQIQQLAKKRDEREAWRKHWENLSFNQDEEGENARKHLYNMAIDDANQARMQKEESEAQRARVLAEDLKAVSEGRRLDPAAALQQQLNLSQQIAAAKASKGANSALASRGIRQAAAQQSAQIDAANAASARKEYYAYTQGQQSLAQAAQLAREEMRSNESIAQAKLQAEQAAANAKRQSGQLGFIGSVAGAGIGYGLTGNPEGAKFGAQLGGGAGEYLNSDKNVKKDVKDAKNTSMDPEHFLNKLSSSSYKYKDEKFGKGTFLSPMAQELEKAGPVGKSMVEDTPEGKMVNYGRGFGAILAAQADLNRRLQKVEGKKG